MSSDPPPTDLIVYRQTRLRRSLTRLHNHPAVDPTGLHASYTTTPHTYLSTTNTSENTSSDDEITKIPEGIVKALFDELVRRELGVDPASNSASQKRTLINSHISAVRAVSQKPSLSDPHFIRRLTAGYSPAMLSQPDLVSKVAPKTVPTMYSPSAVAIHRAIQSGKVERENLEKIQKRNAALEEKNAEASSEAEKGGKPTLNGAALRRSARKRTMQEMEEGEKDTGDDVATDPVRNRDEPPELTALRPSVEAVRKTRSASRKARRLNGGPTASECCFCPDPSLFNDKELGSELIGPFVNRRGQAKLFVHFDCACWAPQVFADSASGQLRRVFEEYTRGRKLKCSDCGGRGATIGCYVQKCKNVFHFRCLEKAGAKRVERFFVAFCKIHAHFGEKKSYQILLEAATIADVAAANRRQDTTHGLDAPHSKHTQLRRRETEVIFSRKMEICSHAGAFESNKVIFLHKRKRTLNRNDRLSKSDLPRSLLASAFDIASGRLAYMALAGQDKVENMTAVKARAAIASRETSSLFLLRNLRNAPMWTKDQITVTKKSDSNVSNPGVAPSESNIQPEEQAQDLVPDIDPNPVETQADDGPQNISMGCEPASISNLKDGSTKVANTPRRSRRRRDGILSSSDEGKLVPREDIMEIGQLESAALPAFKKSIRTEKSSLEKKTELEWNGTQQSSDVLKSAEPKRSPQRRGAVKKNNRTSIGKRRTALQITRDNPEEKPRQGLAGKVKSAWETFLEEQLPKERLLRPDESEAEAMRNMARLWSLFSPEVREQYQECARRGAYVLMAGEKTPEASASRDVCAEPGQGGKYDGSSVKISQRASQSNPNPGLFAGKARQENVAPTHADAKGGSVDSSRKRNESVCLPRKRWGTGRQNEFHLVAVDWDELLPTTLDEDDTNKRVRSPPGSKKS